MTKTTQLIIDDEVNVFFRNLDPKTRRDCYEAVKHIMYNARHTMAVRMGHWDGSVSLFNLNGATYLNALERVLPVIINNGYEIEIEDNRKTHTFDFKPIDENYLKDNKPDAVWPKGHPAEGQPIILRDYQVDAINNFLSNTQSTQIISTGGGKTVTSATLSFLCETYGRTIVIVPNKSLVTQTEKDYKMLGLDVGVFYGDRKEYGHQHTICTWQSLDVLAKGKSKKVKTNKTDFKDFIKDVVCVMVDECHGSSGPTLKNLLAGAFADIPIRWGFTGTIPKDKYLAEIIECVIGPVSGQIRAKDLMDKGVLSNCHIDILQMIDYVKFADFKEENKFLVTDDIKLDYMANMIDTVRKSGNTLVLVNLIETGETLQKLLPNSEFINGKVKVEERNKHYAQASDNDDVLIIATYGTAAVGIDIPRLFNVILFEPGKSFVRVIQSIGRGIRKAKDKDFVNIYDIASTCKYSARHLTERKKYYKEAEYPFTLTKIDYTKGVPFIPNKKKVKTK